MPVSVLTYWRKEDAVHLSTNKGLPWYIENIEYYLEKEGRKKVIINSGGTPDWIKRLFRYQKTIKIKRGIYSIDIS